MIRYGDVFAQYVLLVIMLNMYYVAQYVLLVMYAFQFITSLVNYVLWRQLKRREVVPLHQL